ncbi:hypothetical protein NQ318_015748, partial [Aromia moschata]
VIFPGGTGVSPRDVTPEATKLVIEKELPGISHAMVARSLAVTDMAMLSRAVCGFKAKTLIINLPGSAKGAVECFGFIKNSISHAVALLTDNKELVANTHRLIQGTAGESRVKLTNVADRNRKSPFPMLEVDDAVNVIIREGTPSLEIEVIPFEEAMNRILAEDIYAEEPVPAFPASIKDGYAVKASNGDGERIVRNVAAAGDQPFEEELQNGEAIRISTGAPIPPGADAVVQVEDTVIVKRSADDNQEEVIQINVIPEKGQDIRTVGSDVEKDSRVLKKYERITAAYIGVLAMLGKTEVKVVRRKTIGLLSTGNELKQPDEPLKPGQIRDCNKYTLRHLLKRYSYYSVDCGIAKDEPNCVKSALEKAFSANDIVISTGGVSMGEYDILKRVLAEDFDALIHFGRVNMKPGKPTTFATLNYEGKFKMFFGLPGNPVSCGVTCLLFVIPTLRYLERSRVYEFPVVSVQVSPGPLTNNDERPEYHRVMISRDTSGSLIAESTGNQISSRLNSLVGANGLAIVTKPVENAERCGMLLGRRGRVMTQESVPSSYQAILFDNLM